MNVFEIRKDNEKIRKIKTKTLTGQAAELIQ